MEGFLNSLSRAEIDRMNKSVRADSDRVHRKFKRKLKKGKCFLCGRLLTFFHPDQPCMHWLLRPEGFDKKHAELVFNKFNYLRIDSYLRWMANSESLAGNINDLEEEKNPNKVFEYTIRYKNLEWSFSCGKGDLEGHASAGTKSAQMPHYHFQMRIDGRSFIDYSDLHVPFTEPDLWHLPIILGMVESAGYAHYYGMGMQDAMFRADPEDLLDAMQKSENEDSGMYRVQTLVEAEPGKTISGDDIADIIKKRQETGVPLAKLVRDMKNVGEATTYIMPGPGVPQQAGRASGKKKR